MTMSCRIDRIVSAENPVVLSISGGITGEHVDMLRGELEQESDGFAIDLKNVLLVDREAVKLLALSEANGTELRNCPPYIREWVTRERAEIPERPWEQALQEERKSRMHDTSSRPEFATYQSRRCYPPTFSRHAGSRIQPFHR